MLHVVSSKRPPPGLAQLVSQLCEAILYKSQIVCGGWLRCVGARRLRAAPPSMALDPHVNILPQTLSGSTVNTKAGRPHERHKGHNLISTRVTKW